jgi:hypothetical protein
MRVCKYNTQISLLNGAYKKHCGAEYEPRLYSFWRLRYGLDIPGYKFQQKQEIFLFSRTSLLVLGPT